MDPLEKVRDPAKKFVKCNGYEINICDLGHIHIDHLVGENRVSALTLLPELAFDYAQSLLRAYDEIENL